MIEEAAISQDLALVVEDDAMERGVLTLLLESSGWWVATANDGASAMTLARRMKPTLIVTDLRMPHKSGIDLARDLAAEPGLCEAPRVAVTSDSSELKEAAERSGLFVAVLTKPVAPARFLAIVAQAVQSA